MAFQYFLPFCSKKRNSGFSGGLKKEFDTHKFDNEQIKLCDMLFFFCIKKIKIVVFSLLRIKMSQIQKNATEEY